MLAFGRNIVIVFVVCYCAVITAQDFEVGGDCSQPISMSLFVSNGIPLLEAEGESTLIPSQNGTEWDITCSMNKISDFGCYSACVDLKDGSCDGNDAFCKEFSCDKASICFYEKNKYRAAYFVDGKEVSAKIFPVCNRPSEEIFENFEKMGWTRASRRLLDDGPIPPTLDSVLFTLVQEYTYMLQTTSSSQKTVVFSKEGKTQIQEIAAAKAFIQLNPEFFVRSGYLTVRVYQSTIQIFEESIEITGSKYVRVYDCIFCSEFFTQFGDMPTSMKVVGIFTFATIFGSFIWLMMKGFLFFSVIALMIWSFLKSVYCMTIKPAYNFVIKKPLDAIKKKYAETQESMSKKTDKDVELQPSTAGKKPSSSSSAGVKAALIALGFQGAQGLSFSPFPPCDFAQVIPYTNNVCFTNSNGQPTCSLTTSLAITIPYVGSTTCLDMVDSGGVSSGFRMFVTYESSNVQYSLVQPYYTSSWSYYQHSAKQCSSISSDCEKKCQELNPFDKTARGHIKDAKILGWPGRSWCVASDGCSKNSCTSCGHRCDWKAYSIIPTALKAKVQKLGQMITRPCVNIKVFSLEQLIFDKKLCFENGTRSYGNWTAAILGIGSYDEPDFPQAHIMEPTGCHESGSCETGLDAYFVQASEANQPEAEKIGDIQANDPENFIDGGVNSFKFDPLIAVGPLKSAIISEYGSYFTYKLPAWYSGGLWRLDRTRNIVYSSDYPTGALQLNIQTTNPINYVVQLSAVCPSVEALSMTGCSSCDYGAAIEINALSTCGTGGIVNVKVTCNEQDVELSTLFISITSEIEKYIIQFRTNVVQADCTVGLYFQYGEVYFADQDSIQADLIPPELVKQSEFQNGTYTSSSENDQFGLPKVSAMDKISDLLSMKGNLLGDVIALLAYGVALGVAYGAFAFSKAKLMSWKMSKEKNV